MLSRNRNRGKKAIAKMKTQVRELESKLYAESKRRANAQKNLHQLKRYIKELTFSQEEERKNHETSGIESGTDISKNSPGRTRRAPRFSSRGNVGI
jgi:predicted  nucleic acid-binding Zn-ribbon protein